MTVQTTTSAAQFAGNDATTSFPIGFKFNQEGDLQVKLINDSTGVETPLVLNSDYTVTGEGSETGGSVDTTAPVATGVTLDVRRIVEIVQETDLRNQGKFFPETHEQVFDYLTMIDQQQQQQLDEQKEVLDGFEEDIATASAAAIAAQSSATAADLAYRNFRGVYWGAYSSSPSVDPFGNPPDVGDYYFNTVQGFNLSWNGSTWTNPATTLGTAATRNVQTSESDITSSRVLAVGAHGLPVVANTLALPRVSAIDGTTDCNTMLAAGWWYQMVGGGSGSRNPNHPEGPTGGITSFYQIFTVPYAPGTGAFQLAFPYMSSDPLTAGPKFRLRAAGTWYPWRKIFSDTDTIPVANGGTGATTSAAARTALGVLLAKKFLSAQQTITLGSRATLAHGLGVTPELFRIYYVCVTADNGYSPGDIYEASFGSASPSAGTAGWSCTPDATNINICQSGGSIAILHKSTGSAGTMTVANWRYVIGAWAS